MGRVSNSWRLDPHSISASRFLLGIWILVDLGLRSRDLSAHYSDGGALPRSIVIEGFLRDPSMFSILNSTGSALVAGLFFAATAIAAICFSLGYRTLVSNIVLCVLVTSIQIRNPLILNAGDHIVRVLLLWFLVLPIGAWGLDRRNTETAPSAAFSLIGLAMLLQLGLIYFANGMCKDGRDWAETHTAILRVLRLDVFVTPIGKWLTGFPELLTTTTQVVPWFECILPVLLLIPFRWQGFRLIAFLLAALFHLSIGLTLNIWALGLASMIFWVLTLPPAAWAFAFKVLHRFSRWKFTISSTTSSVTPSWPQTIFATSLFVLMVMNNLSTITRDKGYLPQPASRLSRFLGIEQAWNMFAPTVLGGDRWPVMRAKLADATIVDLYRNGQEVNLEKPASAAEGHKNLRWQSLFDDALKMNNPRVYASISNAFVREWNAENPQRRVLSFELLFIREQTEMDGTELPVSIERRYRRIVPPPRLPGGRKPGSSSTPAPWLRGGGKRLQSSGSPEPTPDPAFTAPRSIGTSMPPPTSAGGKMFHPESDGLPLTDRPDR